MLVDSSAATLLTSAPHSLVLADAPALAVFKSAFLARIGDLLAAQRRPPLLLARYDPETYLKAALCLQRGVGSWEKRSRGT